jgi:hydroxypyruvate isomerase
MRRREFMGFCAGAAVTAASGRATATTSATLLPNSASDTDGVPFTLTVMLWTVYRDLPFPQRLEKVAEAGYHAVELVDEFKNWKPQDFAEARRKKAAAA